MKFLNLKDSLTNTVKEMNLEWIEGVAILIAVLVVVFVTAFNDWRKERQFRGLQNRIESDQMACVTRDSQVKEINIKDIVVGDICLIKYGDLVPADGILVQSNDLMIDESSLTGESDHIKKNCVENFYILSGTHVVEGSGNYLVTGVGLNSETGTILTLLGATDENSSNKKSKKRNKKVAAGKVNPIDENQAIKKNSEAPKHKKIFKKKNHSVLQVKLGKLALKIGYGGMIAAIITFIILITRLLIIQLVINKNAWSNAYIKYIISYLIQAITVVVVAVPEGLPLAVTLALAFAVRVRYNFQSRPKLI